MTKKEEKKIKRYFAVRLNLFKVRFGLRYQIAAKYTNLNEESILHIAKECLISFRFGQLWNGQ